MPRGAWLGGAWLALLGALLAGCGPRGAAEPPGPDPHDPRRPFLWRVDGPGAPSPSYLLGSFHIGVAPDEVLPPSVLAKVDVARTVVLEVDIAVPEALGIERQPPGHSLKDDMSAEQWQKLVAVLKLDADGEAKLEQVKMWALVTTMIQELVPDTPTIDGVVQDRAVAANRTLVFLEDIDSQSKLLAKYMTADMLLRLLDDKEGQRKHLAAEADAYRSGDEKRMWNQSMAPEVFASLEQREEVVFARNRRWLPVIERAVRRGGAFVTVGCSHMIGDRGLVALLRGRGYRVTRIRG
ncbi:MAG TPA: TraB/GumN family protein [Kofleriaceae bacterium]|nr:TraB/GumN family protein [Kofleriaceae bacterium]